MYETKDSAFSSSDVYFKRKYQPVFFFWKTSNPNANTFQNNSWREQPNTNNNGPQKAFLGHWWPFHSSSKWQLRRPSSCVGVCSLSVREGTLSCIPSKWECISLSSPKSLMDWLLHGQCPSLKACTFQHRFLPLWQHGVTSQYSKRGRDCLLLWESNVLCSLLNCLMAKGKIAYRLAFLFFFFYISHISAIESLSHVCFYPKNRFWLKLIVFTKTFFLRLAGGCLYHLFYFDGLITWALNAC